MNEQATQRALDEALDDEYRARATCRAVIDRFGPARPFVNIVESEQRHIEALVRQYQRLGWPVPRPPRSAISVPSAAASTAGAPRATAGAVVADDTTGHGERSLTWAARS